LSNTLAILAVVLVLALLVTATINITLRHFSRVRLEDQLTRRGRANKLDWIVDTHHELATCMAVVRITCVLGVTLLVVRVCELYTWPSLAARYGASFGGALAVLFIFGVAIPSAWARYSGEAILAATLPLLALIWTVLKPVVTVLRVVDSLVRRLAGVPVEEEIDEAERHEQELLNAVSEGEKLGAVDEEEKEMIESVMDLRDTAVAAIMTPRTEIRGVEQSTTIGEVKQLIREIGHSRIPVYEGTIDNIVGIAYAKDLLHLEHNHEFIVADAMRQALFVPETKNLRDLLHEFQNKKVHMAIVLDEYGGTAGLVTFEDILEELVGEIADEYDVDEAAPFVRVDDNTVDIDARMRVDEINAELDLHLPEEAEYETVGGFVFSTLGRIPTPGERFDAENVEIEVLDAEPRRINRVRLHVRPRGPATTPAEA
jgi:CBS domain containing-hemolysin-like protein